MKWINKRSGNVEDRRGSSGRGGLIGGGIGTTIILAIIIWIMGGNPLSVLNNMTSEDIGLEQTEYVGSVSEDSLAQFVSMVLAETEDVWTENFRKLGRSYRKPTLVLFTGTTSSACGYASQATGPFYCPGDEKIYLDLSFYDEMKNRLGAGGDFAFAYVVAHEVGHHVQKLLGIMDMYNNAISNSSQREVNALTVRLELQADFFAGIWANHAQQMFDNLDDDDIDEALNAASAIGDDRLQRQSQGYVVPDSFTHGTSEQRKKWFYKGYQTGDINDGDTFSATQL